MALYGAAVALNDGRYGGPQLAAGFASVAFGIGAMVVQFAATRFRESSFVRLYRPDAEPVKGVAAAAPQDFSGHPFAAMARWSQLVSRKPAAKIEEDGSAVGIMGRLTVHDQDDPDCPCGLASCLGTVPNSAGRQRVVQVAVQLAVELAEWLLFAWAPLVGLGATLWTSPWASPIAALYGFLVALQGPAASVGTTQTNVPALTLARKLHHRAVKIALDDLLSRCATGEPVADPSLQEPYVHLHWTLCATYTSQLRFLSYGHGVIIAGLPIFAVAGVINAAVGRCVPAWIALSFCYFSIWLAVPTAMVAVWNRNIASVAELYRTAAERLLLLEPGSASPAAVERHGRLLGLLRDGIAARRGTFMGITVGLGTVRTYLATLFTVLLGLWTLLRGAGIALTVDSVCPA
ncbi:hypothetical protein DFJ74DRAFT_678793 [Hyaloraphidium curvatum]|nr:hypothetical protein DFJ74DRAFT_678793 [Hyaloraphidium curvatum]